MEPLKYFPCGKKIRLLAWQTLLALMSKIGQDRKLEFNSNASLLLISLRLWYILIACGLPVPLYKINGLVWTPLESLWEHKKEKKIVVSVSSLEILI